MRTYPLRDYDDTIAAQPCKGCGEPLRTNVEEAQHQIQHVADGRLVAFITRNDILVSIWPKKDYDRTSPVSTWLRLKPEALDMTSNALRVKCLVCGDFVHPAYHVERGTFWIHYRMKPGGSEGWTRDGSTHREEDHDPQVVAEIG